MATLQEMINGYNDNNVVHASKESKSSIDNQTRTVSPVTRESSVVTPNQGDNSASRQYDNVSPSAKSFANDRYTYNQKNSELTTPVYRDSNSIRLYQPTAVQQASYNPSVLVPDASQQKKIDTDLNNRVTSWRSRFVSDKKAADDKKAKMRIAIASIGDSFRHIGNLYFTTKGAVPQQIVNQADVMYARQKEEAEKQREYDMAQQKIAYQQQKDALAQANADRSYNLNVANYNRNLEKDKDARALNEQRLGNEKLRQKGIEADNTKKSVDAKYAEAKSKAELDAKNAAIAHTNASTAAIGVGMQKTKKEIEKINKDMAAADAGDEKFPVYTKDKDKKMVKRQGYYYTSKDKDFVRNVVNNLAEYAFKKKWIKQDELNNRASNIQEIYVIIAQHADDEHVQETMRNMYGDPTGGKGGKGKSAKDYGGKK